MGIPTKIALFLGGLLVACVGHSFKMERGSSAMGMAIVAASVLEALIGALLMLTAALGRLPW